MRVALVIVLLTSTAVAEEKGVRVFAAEGALRDRLLDNLVARKQLDARNRAAFPTRQQAAAGIAKPSRAKTKLTKPLDPAACTFVSGNGDLMFECSERSCAGSCQVIRNEVTLRVRNGVWSVAATNVKHLGDTGECGCCMHIE